MNPKIVEIIREREGTLEACRCKKCGIEWLVNYVTGGKLARGSWQCPNGCKPDK